VKVGDLVRLREDLGYNSSKYFGIGIIIFCRNLDETVVVHWTKTNQERWESVNNLEVISKS